MSRILAVDWGRRRVGLAVSDPSRKIARPLATLEVRSPEEACRGILEAARKETAELILIGLPLNADGDEGPSAARARDLGRSLETKGLRVEYRDERWTSEDAVEFLKQRGERRPPKTRIDQVAALLLLQGYLDTLTGGEERA